MRVGVALLAAAAACFGQGRIVWSGPEVTLLGGPSRDGRYLSFVDSARNLAIREVATGRARALTSKPPDSKEFAYFSVISPDSKQVAYAWFNDAGFYDLRIVGTESGGPRVLYRNDEARFVQPCAWSPDGKHVLTLLFRTDNISQIALIPASGGPPRVLRSLNWVYPKRMDWSADGKWIVYDSFAGEGSAERAIYLLAADGSSERKIAMGLFPLWHRDSVVYAAERDGAVDVWQGNRLLWRDAGRILPMGVTAEGELYYGVRSGTIDVAISDLADPVKTARRASMRFPGRNSAPAWSPDGNALAYLSRRGTENFGQEARTIVIRRWDPDEERELLPKLAHIERVRWSPKGLVVSGSDDKGRGGVYLADAETAAVTPVAAEHGASFRGFEAGWSCAGVVYLHGDELRTHDRVLYRGTGLNHLAISPDGKMAALSGAESITILPIEGGTPRTIAFAGATELEWGRDLIAGRGTELWNVERAQPLPAPGNRDPGFSLHPDGKRIALTVGRISSEIRAMRLP